MSTRDSDTDLGNPRPSVSVVIATRDRRELLNQALAAIREQSYDGVLECVVVFDQAPVAHELQVDSPTRPVRVLANTKSPGLAGARNSGIAAAGGELLAFCDDDDIWLPDKLARQVELVGFGAEVVVCGIRIDYGDRQVDRVPIAADLTLEHLSTDRVSAAHPSTLLVTRAAMARIGAVDEAIPGSYGEDYDWLLRAAQDGPIDAVAEPLVKVLWHRGSFFAGRWATIVEALDYLVAKHPSVRSSRRGLARVYGQKAFALAALGRRREACRVSASAFRLNPAERRVYVALLVACHVIKASTVMHLANSRGRGI